MIEKIVDKHDLEDPAAAKRDLAYWLSRPPEERVAAVDAFRMLFHGSSARLQRVARVVEQTRG
jgi:hypothetical protein